MDTLIKKLIKTGKHAEKWPEIPNKKEKPAGGSENKDKEKGSDSSGNSSDDEQNNNNSATENGNLNTQNKPAGPAVRFAGLPENNPVQASGGPGGSAGSGGKKKKKKKKKKSGGAKPAGGPADAGLVAPQMGSNQVVDQMHHSPPRGYPNPMPVGPSPGPGPGPAPSPAYVMSYSEVHPSGNGGHAYYIPPTTTPYVYDYTEDNEDDDFATLSRPSNTFEILSDENPYGCCVM